MEASILEIFIPISLENSFSDPKKLAKNFYVELQLG